MIYYSLQNKETKKLIRVYSTIFYANVCYTFDEIGDTLWLVSEETAKKALETPNFSSKGEAAYDTPYNWLESSEWEVVKIILNVEE